MPSSIRCGIYGTTSRNCVVGSSGTILNLAEIAAKTLHPSGGLPDNILTYKDLKKVIDLIRSTSARTAQESSGDEPGAG